MQRFKFRVWDEDSKKMYYTTLPTIDTLNNKVHFTHGQSNFMLDIKCLQQWTGQKDKNGLDIYEGDLLALRNDVGEWYPIIEWSKGDNEVYWLKQESRWATRNGDRNSEHLPWTPYEVEVKGNIFQK